jgi:putative transposase
VEGDGRVLGEGSVPDPPTPSHANGGRTRMDDRDAFAAMIYVLRTGIQWNALPRQMGASSTVHDA